MRILKLLVAMACAFACGIVRAAKVSTEDAKEAEGYVNNQSLQVQAKKTASDSNSPSALFTRSFVKAGDIDDFFFRHDFSKGTRRFVKGTCSVTSDILSGGATAARGPSGVPGTAAQPAAAWGAFNSTDSAALNGAWSIALHLNAPAVANGVLFSVGRARAAKQKDVIVCTSGDGTKLYLRHVTTTDSDGTKNDAGTDEIEIPGGTANGWHSLVLAFAPTESGSGAGTFKLYWDGALAGTGASTSGYFYGNDGGVQYSKPLSISSDTDLRTFALTGLDANSAYAVRETRFYNRDITSIEAAAFEAACENDRHADVPDLDAYAYVQSAGVNSVDTGYTAVGYSRFAVDFEYTAVESLKSVFGAYEDATHPFHEIYINSSNPGVFAFRKGDTEVSGGTNMSCNRRDGEDAKNDKIGDTERHVAVVRNNSATDSKANIRLYDYADRAVYWKNGSGTSTVNTQAANVPTYIFARAKSSRNSKAKVYSLLIDQTDDPDVEVAVPAAFLAPDVLPDGTAGYRNILTGEFRGESEDSPSTALAYVNGVGCASDYKFEGGVFSTRFWARSSNTAKGGVKFAGQSAEGTNSLFTARLATATLTAEPAGDCAFACWEGDTWAIQNGAATDATITLKSDTAICLKAVFKEKAPAPTCADADAEGAVPMTLPGTLTLSVPAGATLYYTLDGSEPTTESASTTTGEIAIPAGTTTIKVFAAGGDWAAGDTATFTVRNAAETILDFAFRHDFSAGTYTAIKGSADLPAMNWTNYTAKTAFVDADGNFAGYNPAVSWCSISTLLEADWSVAMRVRQVATEGGIVFGVGRANAIGTKEVAICSSSNPDRMSIATVVNTSGNYSKAVLESETVLEGFGDTTNGFHTIVLAFKKTADDNGAGVFTLFFDGRKMGTHETANTNKFSQTGIFQYCTLPSMNETTLANLRKSSMDGTDMAILDMRFYTRALTQDEAAACAAIEHPHKIPATPDPDTAAYIEAFGENYIDTLWKAPKNASFAADFAFTDNKTAQKRIFGIYNGENSKFAEDGLVHGFYINGAATPKFAFVKASEFTSEDGGTWISTGVNADTARHRFTLEDADSTDAGSVGKLYNHGKATAVKTANSKRVHAAAALRNTYIFACNKAGAADWHAKAKLYSFEASAGGTEPELHLAPVKLGDGKIGLRDTNTGRFYADAAENPQTVLSYSDGIGRAADWKSEKGYLYARFHAASATPAFGGVKFGDAGAAANTDTFVKRGETATLEAVANEGYRFVEWQGDTWAIQNGGKAADAAITLKNDAPVALKAVFERDPVANTPDKFVEYIESTNGQYIDTGVEAKAGIYAEMGVAWTDNQSYNCFLGAKDTATSGKNVILAMRQTAWLFLRGYGTVSDASYEDTTLPTLTPGTFRDIKTEISPAGVWTATIDNSSSVADFSEREGALDIGLTMYAFARHVNTGSGVDCTSKARCRYLRIWAWNADTAQYKLKRWYRPCVKDGRAALYDEVSQFIFYSQSGADFAAGPDFDMMPGAFVQSYGASDSRATEKGNFIDTGIAPASDMTFKADYRFTETNAQDRAFGMRGGFTVNHYLNGSRCFAFCMSSKENWTPMKNPSNKVVEGNTNRHWIAMASATATLSQDVRTNIVATTTDANATATGEAERTLYLFDEHRGDTTRHPGHVVLYTFIVEKDGAPVGFFAPARDATTGRAGMKNLVTGEFRGEGNANALSPLLYREGIGSADDYKYENGTLKAKVYAKAADGGSIVFDGGAAAGTGEFGFPYAWREYGASTTLEAVPVSGFKFAGWQGDTWAIQNDGKATDRTIAVKSDTAMQFKAVFEKRKGFSALVK